MARVRNGCFGAGFWLYVIEGLSGKYFWVFGDSAGASDARITLSGALSALERRVKVLFAVASYAPANAADGNANATAAANTRKHLFTLLARWDLQIDL